MRQPDVTEHKDRVRKAFALQVDSYANSAVVAAEDARRRFVAFVGVQPTDRVLDVATGPGFLAFHFAEQAAEVVGIDLTQAMLQRARSALEERQFTNVSFEEGDAESLHWPDATFDVVTCGSAYHHFADPACVLAETVRVVRSGGRVGLLDIITSELPDKAALHNRIEQWRDPSHTRCLPLSELIAMFGRASLRDLHAVTYSTPRETGEWLAISRTPADVAGRVKTALADSIPNDATGLGVRCDGDRICFNHTFAWLIGTRA